MTFIFDGIYRSFLLIDDGIVICVSDEHPLKAPSPIEEYAFCNCSSLLKNIFPPDITSIGDYALYMCSALAKIEIPKAVNSIGENSFDACSSLTQIIIPNNVKLI